MNNHQQTGRGSRAYSAHIYPEISKLGRFLAGDAANDHYAITMPTAAK